MKKNLSLMKEDFKKKTEELHDHIQRGRVDQLKRYLHFSGNPNVAFGKHNSLLYNQTLLGIACEFGQKECVKALLESNANPNLRSYNAPGYAKSMQTKEFNHGATPLMVCMNSKYKDKEEIARLLIRYGALVNDVLLINSKEFHQKPFEEKIPTNSLHCAVLAKDRERIKLLLNHGGDVNLRDIYGQTAAHKAASIKDKETILLLKSYGADLGVRDVKGKTPREILAMGRTLSLLDKDLKPNGASDRKAQREKMYGGGFRSANLNVR
jgi:ankyrin repeat protein